MSQKVKERQHASLAGLEGIGSAKSRESNK
jgi:hypothetical protein